MGYAKSHEYAFMEIKGFIYPNFTMTSADGDFNVGDFSVPIFSDPLRYAFVDVYLQYVKNSNVAANWMETGTVGEVRIMDTVTTNEFIISDLSDCYVDAGYWRPGYIFTGTYDVHDHIVSGRSFSAILKGFKANKDSLLVREPYPVLRMYFG